MPSFFILHKYWYLYKKLLIQTFSINALIFLKIPKIQNINFKILKKKWIYFKIKYINEVSELIILSLLTKNLNGIIRWIKKYFSKNIFKLHEKLAFFIRIIFTYIVKKLKFILGIKGFFFNLKGKIKRKGNARTTRFFVRWGETSLAKKNLKLYHKKEIIWSKTGVLGCKLFFFF